MSNDNKIQITPNFEVFVKENIYQKHKELQKLIKSQGLGSLSQKIGDAAENFVLSLLIKKGYTTFLSPYSKTPYDVYAIKWCGYFWHLVVVQVKGSATRPAKLTEKGKEKCKNFAEVIKGEFLEFYEACDSPVIIDGYYKGIKVLPEYKCEKNGVIKLLKQITFNFGSDEKLRTKAKKAVKRLQLK